MTVCLYLTFAQNHFNAPAMALVESLDLPLNTPLPAFKLADPFGKIFSETDLMGPEGLLVAFTCNHCPYAIAIWPRLIDLASAAKKLGIHTVAINPNIHPDYPEDAPEKMREKISEWKIHFPYLVDESQNIAKTFQAQCTPDLYLFNGQAKLAYHGQLDNNWKDATRVTKRDLWDAIECLHQKSPLSTDQKPSMGCSIKWRT